MSDSRPTGRDQGVTSGTPPRDEQAHRKAVEALCQQADSLGILDALEAEPALIYTPSEATP